MSGRHASGLDGTTLPARSTQNEPHTANQRSFPPPFQPHLHEDQLHRLRRHKHGAQHVRARPLDHRARLEKVFVKGGERQPWLGAGGGAAAADAARAGCRRLGCRQQVAALALVQHLGEVGFPRCGQTGQCSAGGTAGSSWRRRHRAHAPPCSAVRCPARPTNEQPLPCSGPSKRQHAANTHPPSAAAAALPRRTAQGLDRASAGAASLSSRCCPPNGTRPRPVALQRRAAQHRNTLWRHPRHPLAAKDTKAAGHPLPQHSQRAWLCKRARAPRRCWPKRLTNSVQSHDWRRFGKG